MGVEKEAPFEWTVRMTALLLESCITDEGVVLTPLSKGERDPFVPMKLFANYLRFCQKAFENGIPPENCSIDEFERKLFEQGPPWVFNKTKTILRSEASGGHTDVISHQVF